MVSANATSRLTPPEISEQAALLRGAYTTRVPIHPIRQAFPEATISDAYAIQSANADHWRSEGKAKIGAKIGLTAKAVQAQMGVSQPDFGLLYSDMVIPDGDLISHHRLLQPRVEAEVAFVLSRTPNADRLNSAEIIRCIEFALPAIEVVDSRIANWDIGIVDTIADNASSGMIVLGTSPRKVSNLDLRLCGMVLEKNGSPTSFGAGAACLGNPLHALAWLAKTMHDVGSPLQEGDTILSGALGPIVPVVAGDYVDVRIADLGSVRTIFGRAE